MTGAGRVCRWCRGPVPDAARSDAVFCSTRCRQAQHRFRRGVGDGPSGPSASGTPLRLAYADPPYPGLARKYYGDHADYGGEVNHAELVASLSAEFDGWALSTSSAALPEVLAVCPPGVRVGAWVRGERPTRSRGPQTAWEPVVFTGGRLRVDLVGATDPSGSPAAANGSRCPGGRDAGPRVGRAPRRRYVAGIPATTGRPRVPSGRSPHGPGPCRRR